jgi:hypothetical protein
MLPEAKEKGEHRGRRLPKFKKDDRAGGEVGVVEPLTW